MVLFYHTVCDIGGIPVSIFLMPEWPQVLETHWAFTCIWKHASIACCFIYTDSGGKPVIISRAMVGDVLIAPVM